MSRELLPEIFHIRSRKNLDKNRAIVSILLEFGIQVHDYGGIGAFNSYFNENHNLCVNENYLCGLTHDLEGQNLTMSELLEAYGKLKA